MERMDCYAQNLGVGCAVNVGIPVRWRKRMKEILETIYLILSSLINQVQNYNEYEANRMIELRQMLDDFKNPTDKGKGEQ
jgi:hypothetical protein